MSRCDTRLANFAGKLITSTIEKQPKIKVTLDESEI